jgi:CRP/FNR family cyclic AMP-dependent transcriptional regulator
MSRLSEAPAIAKCGGPKEPVPPRQREVREDIFSEKRRLGYLLQRVLPGRRSDARLTVAETRITTLCLVMRMWRTNDSIGEDGQRLLMACPLFKPLDGDLRSRLAARARRLRCRAGDVIFDMGEEGQNMMAVLSGIVRVSIPSPQGKQIVLADLSAGEVFGEIALLDGGYQPADATALTNCDLAVLSRRDVLPLLQQRPDVCFTLLAVVCQRLRESQEKMTDILFFNAPVRLAKILLRGAGRRRDEEEEGEPALKVAFSQRELGNMAGVRRERVNHCLREWQRRGLIALKGGWIVILKPAVLEEVVRRG